MMQAILGVFLQFLVIEVLAQKNTLRFLRCWVCVVITAMGSIPERTGVSGVRVDMGSAGQPRLDYYVY